MYRDEILIAAEAAAELRCSSAAGRGWSGRCPLHHVGLASGWIVARDSMGLKSNPVRKHPYQKNRINQARACIECVNSPTKDQVGVPKVFQKAILLR